jgi:hypothetical protein
LARETGSPNSGYIRKEASPERQRCVVRLTSSKFGEAVHLAERRRGSCPQQYDPEGKESLDHRWRKHCFIDY